MADWTPQSRSEEILFKTINGEPYDGLPQSRIEELLLELKEVIEQGGGGGGAGYTETTLFTGTHQTYNREITLNDDLDNYDLVIFWTRWADTSTNCEVPFFANVKHFVDTFIYNNGSTTQSSPHMGLTAYNDQYLRIKRGSAKNKLLLFDSHSIALTKVVGLKYIGGGGTSDYEQLSNLPQINGTTLKGNKTTSDLGLPSVTANPTGEAVGELTSIDINGSKYSIPESSEYEETTVWTGSKDMLTSFTVNITDPYTDYDALRFEYESGNASHNFATHYERLISKDTLATPEWFSLSDFYLANGAGVNTVGKFTDATNLSVNLNSVNWFTSCTLTKIVGIKYGNGVSSGGGSVERVTLSDTTITSAGTYALSDNYTEFDQIEVWHASSSYASQECECTLIGVDTLKSMMDENRTYTLSAFGERFINLTFSSSAINVSRGNGLAIVKIIGVRFSGSGGGGGTRDYSQLQNKPQINGVTLTGDKTSSDLDLVDRDDELTTAQMSALIALLDQ